MKLKLLIIFILSTFSISAQNTIGIVSHDPTESYNGFSLFAPLSSNETFLINNCGQVVHKWSNSSYSPAASVYLLENGNLLRTAQLTNNDITFGGVGGRIELFDWDDNLLWEYNYSSPTITQHHDIYPLPNGNVLMLAVSTLSQSEAIQAGRNPALLTQGKLYNEHILELQPVGSNQANIVWEWHVKDHLIQDFDSNKDNYGIVADNPGLLDINFLNNNNGEANWLHINSIQYNEDLDQIIMSSRRLSEIYVIDHSTTTQEAASHTGGNYGKGGDFLFRWGNPLSYDKGTSNDQTLYSQHHPHWIASGLNDEGKIMVFNNGNSRGYSSIDIIDPLESAPGVYQYNASTGYGPMTADWSYSSPNPNDFFSAILSSGQRLPNGNTLICDGDSGYFFEITPSQEIVWEYISPVTTNGILSQGDTPSQNNVFRVEKFSYDYPAFIGRDLTPGDPIEINPDISDCTLLSRDELNLKTNLIVYPNPTTGVINIKTKYQINKIEIFNALGKKINSVTKSKMDISNLSDGLYFIKIYSNNNFVTKRVIKN